MPSTLISPDYLVATARNLPAAPRTMARLQQLLMDSHSGLPEIAALLRQDAALAARIVSIANSAAYGGGGLIGSIEEALQRVGFGEIFRLVGLVTSQAISTPLTCYGFTGERMQAHTLYTGLAAESVARHARLDARSAYTAGLLRRLGMVLLNQLGSQTLRAHEYFAQSGYGAVEKWEKATFGYDHREVSVIVFEAWKFPSDIIAAASGGLDGPGATALSKVLVMADSLTRMCGQGLPGMEGSHGVTTEEREANGLPEGAVDELLGEVRAAHASLGALG